MKYIKTYENKNREPQIGDYVICEENIYQNIPDREKLDYILENFLNENVGKCINIITYLNDDIYIIEYDNIPLALYDYFKFKKNGTADIKFEMSKCRGMNRKEIIHFSPDKEDLEIMIAAKKYNL